MDQVEADSDVAGDAANGVGGDGAAAGRSLPINIVFIFEGARLSTSLLESPTI
jgi:hypothetical protein